MERTFAKPPEARQLEARARTLGVRVAVLSAARRYVTHSQSEPGVTYTVERTPAGWACSCLGYFHTGCCKHLGAVEHRAAREGWPFGQVAALSRVERFMPLAPASWPAPRPRLSLAEANALLFGEAAD